MATSVMQVRVDDELKAQAAAIYEDLGIDPSKEGLQSRQGCKSHV